MTQHWSVNVVLNGETLVSVGDRRFMGKRSYNADEMRIIRLAVKNVLEMVRGRESVEDEVFASIEEES